MMASQFTPKQALARTAQNMALLMGNGTHQVARKIVARLPPFPPSSVVLDNACGNGVVTDVIMETQNSENVSIHATDIGPTMCQATAKLAESKGWGARVHAEVMPAEKLTFADNTFTHSFTNFLIFGVQDPDAVANEIYRTMKPGAYACVTTWHRVAHEDALLAAHAATRGNEAKHPAMNRQMWKDPDKFKAVMLKAGFSKVDVSQCETLLTPPDVDHWTQVAWGFLGAPVGGWTQADEDKWDEATKIFHDKLVTHDLFESDGKGGARITMVANVATLTK
jgi:ubiquinone/menaquinone biosynthesis C-methylase UbiE